MCASSGVLAVLVSLSSGEVLYVCPMCGVAWQEIPTPQTVDDIIAIESAAPEGLRYPTDREIIGLRAAGVQVTEVVLDDWRGDLEEVVRVSTTATLGRVLDAKVSRVEAYALYLDTEAGPTIVLVPDSADEPTDLEKAYRVGQVVRVRIVASIPEERMLKGSLRGLE